MPDFTVAQLSKAQYIVPTIKAYNRLELRARTADFDRSLKAEVRDPLWLLTRQWQYGEFQGEDSATAAYSKFVFEHRTVDRINFNGKTIPFDAKRTFSLSTFVSSGNCLASKGMVFPLKLMRSTVRCSKTNFE